VDCGEFELSETHPNRNPAVAICKTPPPVSLSVRLLTCFREEAELLEERLFGQKLGQK